MLPAGADTPFYLSGKTYLEVLRTPPSGNAYYILAHAFIAAEMNRLNGASFGDAAVAWNEAKAVFEAYTPAQIAVLRGRVATELRGYLLARAMLLDAYNNGLTGPGHCDE